MWVTMMCHHTWVMIGLFSGVGNANREANQITNSPLTKHRSSSLCNSLGYFLSKMLIAEAKFELLREHIQRTEKTLQVAKGIRIF